MLCCYKVFITIMVISATVGLTPATSLADEHPFMREYNREEPALLKQYFTNVRSKVSIVGYGDEKRQGVLTHRIKFTTVSDGKSCRANSDAHRLSDGVKDTGGVMWYGFEAYDFERRSGPNYKLTDHKSSADTDADPHIDGLVVYSYIFAPFSLDAGLPFSKFVRVMTRQKDRRGYHFAIESVERLRRGDYDAVRVVTSKGDPAIRTTTYLDAGNHFAFREYESDGIMEMPSRAKLPIKQAGELSYAPGPDGYPIPRTFKEWFVHPDGRKVPKVTVTWEEFARYTPAADDFDLEKQFGIKRLPPPAGLSEAMLRGTGRSWRWLYAVAAVLALVTGGLVVVARRRRSAPAI